MVKGRQRGFQRQQHLEQRVLAEIPLGLQVCHELFERHILVGIGL